MPRAMRIYLKRMVMNRSQVISLCTTVAVVLFSSPLTGFTQNSRSDPDPVYSAASPVGPFIFQRECDQDESARISLSYFRQSANKAGEFNTQITYQPAFIAGSSTDVELGDMYGPWDILALFYPEKDGNADVQNALVSACHITGTTLTDLTPFFDPIKIDINSQFGFDSVPIEYRKYGARFEVDIATPWDLGTRIQTGFARIQQYPKFNDLTPNATGSQYTSALKAEMSQYIMQQLDIIADTLKIDIGRFCKSEIEDVRIGLYWRHAFEANFDTVKDSYMPKFTFVPYIMAEISPLTTTPQSYGQLFSVPFGNDGHTAFGVTGGFTLNFLDMLTMALDGGMTHFSCEMHRCCPVPTNDAQVGIFPRKANLIVQPGNNFTFGASLFAEHFWYNFSASVEFRTVNHNCDRYAIASMVSVPTVSTAGIYPVSNIDLDVLHDRSSWSSSFVNTGLTYDLSEAISIGFFWQAPVRQHWAYRSTTVMGSIIGTF